MAVRRAEPADCVSGDFGNERGTDFRQIAQANRYQLGSGPFDQQLHPLAAPVVVDTLDRELAPGAVVVKRSAIKRLEDGVNRQAGRNGLKKRRWQQHCGHAGFYAIFGPRDAPYGLGGCQIQVSKRPQIVRFFSFTKSD